jgi:hypothetical protein
MIRALAGLLVVVLVGIPLLAAPSTLVGAFGLAAGALCAGGIFRLSIPLLTAGASLSLIEYALALWMSAGSPDFVGAVGVGVTVALLFQIVGFAARFQGVVVDARVLWAQARSWVGTGAASAAVAILLAVGAGSIALRLPFPAYPAVAALGVLAAFLGVVRMLIYTPGQARLTSTSEDREVG